MNRVLLCIVSAVSFISCSGLVANKEQVFLSKENHPNYEVAFFPDSEIHPSMFKVTPKQRAYQIMEENCPSGYVIGEKRTEKQVMAQIDSTATYRFVSFKCKD